MKQMTFLLSIFFLLFSSASMAEKNIIHKYNLSSEIKSIRIQVHHAHVRVLRNKNKKQELRVKYKGNLKMEESNDVFAVSEGSFPNEKNVWKLNNKKRSVMVLWVPKLPIEIALFSGKVEMDKLKQIELSVFMPGRGAIQLKNTDGKINIFQGTGNINIRSHKGDLAIQSEDSRIHLRDCRGKINLSGFKGHVKISKSRGHLIAHSFKSPLIINHFTGRLDFWQEKGGVYLKPMIGSVSGYSGQGEVRGTIHPNVVDLETDKGKIHLDFPYSRAWLTAQTWEGKVAAPRYFNRVKTGGMERVRGRLKGSKNNKGNISLKSHSGSIRVYQSVQ